MSTRMCVLDQVFSLQSYIAIIFAYKKAVRIYYIIKNFNAATDRKTVESQFFLLYVQLKFKCI